MNEIIKYRIFQFGLKLSHIYKISQFMKKNVTIKKI